MKECAELSIYRVPILSISEQSTSISIYAEYGSQKPEESI